jgi:hypothetical protein
MKSAMQELIDKVEHAISYNVEGGLVEKYTWEELFKDMYVLLEKEKEQIENAHAHHRCIHDKTMECTIEAYKSAEKYYNQTYNQEETLEEWKSKFTHHCAIKTNQNK